MILTKVLDNNFQFITLFFERSALKKKSFTPKVY